VYIHEDAKLCFTLNFALFHCLKMFFLRNKYNHLTVSTRITFAIHFSVDTGEIINHHFCSEFEVDSINFPGQTHRWRLSGLLQRGRDRRRDTLLDDLALATRFVVVTAKCRIFSHCFSVAESAKSLVTGILRLLGN